MQDFYHADQGDNETIPSFATQIESLLSQIRDRFPDQLPHQEEQWLLKDCLFHSCKKSIWDIVNYCFADPHLDYMHFLEECRKAEEEGKVAQTKAGTKAKVAAATISPTKEDELTKQLKYQQYQIDALVGQVKNLISAVKATQASLKGARPGGFGRQPQTTWRGGSGEGTCLCRPNPEPLSSQNPEAPTKQGTGKSYNCWQCGEVGHLKYECPTLKGKGLFQEGNA